MIKTWVCEFEAPRAAAIGDLHPTKLELVKNLDATRNNVVHQLLLAQ